MLTQERLKHVVSYDPETGIFTWLKATSNRVHVGRVVGSKLKNGYLDTRIDGKHYLLHRLAWFYVTGNWPVADIDHVNGDRANNKWLNLRSATRRENLQNRRTAGPKSKTGLLGASPDNGMFRAQIKAAGVAKFLGRFETPEAAHLAYIEAKRKYHPGGTL